VGAFDKWTKVQTIEIYRNFKFGIVCKATIINHAIDEEVYQTIEGKYYFKVLTKCGYVGRHRHMPIYFPIIAESRKEAAKIARTKPRVKKEHKDAILEVVQITKKEYEKIKEDNNFNPI
jgi:hypothetical protein